jgi:hypothetical protein
VPTGTRRARERASTRERIIGAALHVLESEGASALTIRRIATDVEYSAPVVYQHFARRGRWQRTDLLGGGGVVQHHQSADADEPLTVSGGTGYQGVGDLLARHPQQAQETIEYGGWVGRRLRRVRL